MKYRKLRPTCKPEFVNLKTSTETFSLIFFSIRKTFAKNSLKFIRDNKFDGLDLDWVSFDKY